MNKNILAVLILILAILIYPFFVAPLRDEVDRIKLELATLDESIAVAEGFNEAKQRLVAKSSSFTSEELEKIDKIIPTQVDRLQFIVDTDALARRHGLRIVDKISTEVLDPERGAGQAAAQSAQEPPIAQTVAFRMTLSGPYTQFLSFLEELARSLSLADISTVTFNSASVGRQNASAERGVYVYQVSITTNTLRP